MRPLIIWTIRIVLTIVICVLVFALGYYSYFNWRQKKKYPDRVTIVAYYMRYACGECSVDMKVQSIDNKKYQFIVEHDIFPIPKIRSSDHLCDFIKEMAMRYQLGRDSLMQSFTIIGYLHKYPHELPIFDCSPTPYFTAEKIKYGNDKWHNF